MFKHSDSSIEVTRRVYNSTISTSTASKSGVPALCDKECRVSNNTAIDVTRASQQSKKIDMTSVPSTYCRSTIADSTLTPVQRPSVSSISSNRNLSNRNISKGRSRGISPGVDPAIAYSPNMRNSDIVRRMQSIELDRKVRQLAHQ